MTAFHSIPTRRRGGRLISIATQLYAITALSAASIVALAYLASHFAASMYRSAERARADIVLGLGQASVLAGLLDQHRSIVNQSLMSVVERRLYSDLLRSDEVAAEIQAVSVTTADPDLDEIAKLGPRLADEARQALLMPERPRRLGARDGAASYAAIAASMEERLRAYRDRKQAEADELLRRLLAAGKDAVSSIGLMAAVCLAMVVTLGIWLSRSVATRLAAITDTMRRLSSDEIAVTVPSCLDRDEVGAMARAIEVFKLNAIEVGKKHAENERLARWLDVALNNMARGLSMFDADRRLVLCNSLYRTLYGVPEDLAQPGTSFDEIVRGTKSMQVGANAPQPSLLETWIAAHRELVSEGREFTATHRLEDGRVISIVCRPLEGGGWVDVHEDVTEKQSSAERIRELAERDPLTSLYNRRSFHEELETRLAHGPGAAPFVVLWIDLDRFKAVNDTYGHPAGDELLKAAATAIRACVREGDFVARLGGDEFAIIAEGAALVRTRAAGLAERLIHALSENFLIEGHQIRIGASVGIASVGPNSSSPDELMKNADVALYAAKANGRGRYAFYDRSMESELKHRSRLELDLGQAIARNELQLQYQPIVRLSSHEVVSFEALLRWEHGEFGPVSPAEFIPLAEEGGLIGAIGAWVIEEACREAAGWPSDISVSVNLSPAQFDTSDVGSLVRAALNRTGLDPSRLQLEVTESLVMTERPKTWAALLALRSLGVSIALDDFGTGYSSLSYLRSFPFDKLKIDRDFIRALDETPENLIFIRAITALSSALGMKTVAEGVETEGHLRQVWEAGCDEVQGYYFSRPVSADRIAGLLAQLSRRRQAA